MCYLGNRPSSYLGTGEDAGEDVGWVCSPRVVFEIQDYKLFWEAMRGDFAGEQ